jgi:hypothetical protein
MDREEALRTRDSDDGAGLQRELFLLMQQLITNGELRNKWVSSKSGAALLAVGKA